MYEVRSCIRGFHVYHTVWKPYIKEQLDWALDWALNSSNSDDPFAVAVQKDSETIGHEQQSTIRGSCSPQARISLVCFYPTKPAWGQSLQEQVSGHKLAWVPCGSTLLNSLELVHWYLLLCSVVQAGSVRCTRGIKYEATSLHQYGVVWPYRTCLSNTASMRPQDRNVT